MSPAGRGVDATTASRIVLDATDISRALTRIAHEILERNKGSDEIIVLGIPRRGVPLAHRIAATMASVEGTDIPARGVDGAIVVLVDDVLFSGRTIRAALDALGDVGRPRGVQLAVLVDRGHRRLPIRADFVGKNLPTSLLERVTVTLAEVDDSDAVVISAAEGACW